MVGCAFVSHETMPNDKHNIEAEHSLSMDQQRAVPAICAKHPTKGFFRMNGIVRERIKAIVL